jgi:hypothetical protein
VTDVAVIGSAHIVVKAITTGFQRDVKKALQDMRPALEKEGQQSARSFSKGFKDQSQKSLSNFKPLRGTKENFEVAGQSSAKTFATSFKRQSSESLDSFNPFRGKQAQFRESGQKAGTAFGSGLKKQIRESLANLDSTFDRGGKRAGKAFGDAFRERTSDSLSKFDPTRGTKDIYSGAGRRAGSAFITDFKKDIRLALKDLENDFYKAGEKGGRRFQQGFKNQTKSFKKYFDNLFDKDAGEGRVGRFLSSLTGKFGKFRASAREANDAFFRMVTTGYALGPAIAGVISSISALISGLFAVTSAALAATPALIVLPGIFAAIGQGALAAKLAFSGMGDAIKELKKPTKAAKDNADRIEQAENRLLRVLESNRESLARADKNLERAERDLTEARKEAAESLQQLNFDAEDAAISERRAAIELEKARETLARVQDLPPNSRARREAELAYAEADLNLRRAKDRNSDLAAETEEANRKGVEGSDEVVAATERVQEAIDDKARAERDAIRAQLEAEKELEKARKGTEDAAASTTSALDKLSDEARRFAEFIVGLEGDMLKLKHAAGRELFGPLEQAIQKLVDDLFPVLERILEKTGGALGRVAVHIADVVTEARNLEELERIGDTNVYVIEGLGEAFGNLYDVLLSLLDAAGPLIQRFVDWIVTVTERWKTSLEDMNSAAEGEVSELTEYFNRAGDVAAQLGEIFSNIGDALMNLGAAASGPGSGGQNLLDLFQEATERWATFTEEALEDGRLETFFIEIAENFASISRFLAGLTGVFIRLGNNPGIKGFFDTLNQGGGLQMLEGAFDTLTSAGPAVAEFLLELGETLAYFTESESIENFFGVMTTGLEYLNKALANETVREIFLMTAAFLGAAKGVQLMLKVGWFFSKAFAGYFVKAFDVVKAFGGAIYKLGGLLAGDVGAFRILLTGGGAVAAIGAVIGALVLMWKNSETFRTAVMNLVAGVFVALTNAFYTIKEAIDAALEPFGGMNGAWESLNYWMGQVGDFMGTYIIPLIQFLLVEAIDVAAIAISYFIGIISSIIQVFQGVWEFVQGIFALFKGDMDGVSEHFGKAWEKIKGAISTAIQFAWDFLKEIFGKILDWVEDIFGVDIRAIFSGIGDFIGGVWEGIKTAFSTAWGFITGVISGIGNIFSTAFSVVSDVVEGVLNGIGLGFQKVGSFISGVAGTITGAFKTAFNFVADIWNNTAGKLSWTVPWWVPKIGNATIAVPKIPTFDTATTVGDNTSLFQAVQISAGRDRAALAANMRAFAGGLAEGGIVPAVSGGMLAVIGEGGRRERVEPLDEQGLSTRDRAIIQQLSGGGITLNVYPSAGMDEAELAAMVSRQLAFQLRKGAFV